MEFVREDEAGGYAWEKIENAEFPPKALRHLIFYAFRGQRLVVQKANRKTGSDSGHAAGYWASEKAA